MNREHFSLVQRRENKACSRYIIWAEDRIVDIPQCCARDTRAAVRRIYKDFSEVSSLGFLVKSGVFWLELSNLVLSFFSIWSFGERGDFANVTFI